MPKAQPCPTRTIYSEGLLLRPMVKKHRSQDHILPNLPPNVKKIARFALLLPNCAFPFAPLALKGRQTPPDGLCRFMGDCNVRTRDHPRACRIPRTET